MTLDADKCHFMIFGEKKDKMKLFVGMAVLEESDEETLLGVNLTSKLMCRLFVKRPARNCMLYLAFQFSRNPKKTKLMISTFIMSQFSCCPLIWMFHDRNVNNKINRIQERALRTAYKDNTFPYEKLLENDNSVSIHQKNL